MNKVSIIMPCFNDGEYIKDSIQSVLNSTYKNIELIVIDDGSTDEKTITILRELNDSGAKVLHTERLRPAGARNYGISYATGTYVLPVDSDDLIDATYIEKAVALLDQNENLGIVYCYAELFGERYGRWDLPDYSFEKMLLDNVIFVTAMFRKSDWEKIGGFNTKLIHGMEDYDFWLSILELNREVIQIPEILFKYRIKPSSRTTNFMSECQNVKETYRDIYLNHPKFYSENSEEYALILREALIDQIYLNRTIRESIPFANAAIKIPLIKKILKKILMNKG